MKLDGENITLTESEVSKSACPLDPRWAAGFLRRLGIDACAESAKISRYLSCPSVLEAAGYTVTVLPDPEAASEPDTTTSKISPTKHRKA